MGGVKTFTDDPIIPDEAYGVGWNGSLEPPTKNAVYDKIETLGGGGSYTDEEAQDAAAALFTPDDGDIDFTYNDATPSITATIKAGAVGSDELAADVEFTSVTVAAEAYDEAGWNGDTTVPTKNDVRDKIEAMVDTDPAVAGVTGADAVLNIVSCTTAEYGAGSPGSTMLYIITDA